MKRTGYAPLSESDLDLAFGALAAGPRRAILARLAQGEASVGELAAPFAMSQPAVSKHLKVLEKAGLIRRGRDAQRRPCQLVPERLREVSEWLGTYRQFWEESYDRLDQYLSNLQTPEKQHVAQAVPKARDRRSPR